MGVSIQLAHFLPVARGKKGIMRRIRLALVGAALALLACQLASAQDTEKKVAKLKVLVPPVAQVTVDGKATTSTGPVRYFETPPLAPDKTFTYELRASW